MNGQAPHPDSQKSGGAPRPGSVPPAFAILIGILRLARGRADGLAMFGNSVSHFSASLAPFIALPLAGGLLMFMAEPGWGPVGDLLASWCAVLAPLVLSWELARLWGRQDHWLRYATAFNWCVWALPVAWMVLLITFSIAAQLGLDEAVAQTALQGSLGFYALWLHWFIARHGLELSRARAALLVLVVNVGTGVLVLGPTLLAQGV